MNRYEVLDLETGELIPAVTWVRRKWKGEPFIVGFQAAFATIAKDRELGLAPKNVLLYLFSRLDFENNLHVPQVEIARELGMHESHVSTAIKLLLAKGLLIEGPRLGRSRTLRINPELVWKGSLKNNRRFRLVQRQEAPPK